MNRALSIGALAMALAALPAAAQSPSTLSIDATLGAGFGHGGENPGVHRGVALDGIAAWRLGQSSRSLIVGATASFQGSIAQNDLCAAAASGGCVPDFPLVYAAGMVAGVELTRARGRTIRLLAGPAWYEVDDGGEAVGLQARSDLST